MRIYFEGQPTNVKEVPAKKQYWFIRTYGGEAYRSYIKGGYVGLGYNNVPYRYINQANFEDESSMRSLRTYLQRNETENKIQITRIANQLVAFDKSVSKGDCVIIPSRGSEILAFGTVQGDVYLDDKPGTINVKGRPMLLPEKRRKVKWEKSILKDDPRNDIKGLTSPHYGITNANFYSDAIEAILSSLFVKNDQGYLVIQFDQDEEINAFELNRFLTELTYFYREFALENDSANQDENLTIKIKLQSKGKMLLKAGAVAGLIGLGGLIVLSNNNSVKLDLKNFTIEGKSDGFLKSMKDFLNDKEERRERAIRFDDSIRNLKAFRDTSPNSVQHMPDEPKEGGK